MMNYIWAGIISASLVFGIFSGKISDVSSAMISGAQDGVELILGMMGAMCLWNGLMKIAEQSGLTKAVAKIIRPLIYKLMPDVNPDGAAMDSICMNVTANLLGLGNAATPLGLRAMKELQREQKTGSHASDSMVTFVVMNTASISLLPTTAAILRARHGAAAPFEITPCVWIASVVALAAGLFMTGLLSKRGAKTRLAAHSAENAL